MQKKDTPCEQLPLESLEPKTGLGTGNDEKNGYQLAIEAIDECVRNYRVTFEIRRQRHNKSVSQYAGQWWITVLGTTFRNKDFVQAAQDAVTFVYNAHRK